MLPEPYYKDDFVTIYHGDCRKILPLLEPVDLVLTDPPYGINVANRSTVGGNEKVKRKGQIGNVAPTQFLIGEWDKTAPPKWLFDLMREISKNQVFFGGNYFELPATSCYLIWDKDNADTNFADCEIAWTNKTSAIRKFKWRWNGCLQEDMSKKEFRQHPTQKPLPLMKWCIGQFPEAKTILDPFMGSGTTLVAAKDLGLKAIGIELSEKYCAIAVERLRQESLLGIAS